MYMYMYTSCVSIGISFILYSVDHCNLNKFCIGVDILGVNVFIVNSQTQWRYNYTCTCMYVCTVYV